MLELLVAIEQLAVGVCTCTCTAAAALSCVASMRMLASASKWLGMQLLVRAHIADRDHARVRVGDVMHAPRPGDFEFL